MKQAAPEGPALFSIDGTDYRNCPVGSVDRALANEAFSLHRFFCRGFMPLAGGVYDQPERLLAIIETIEAVRQEIRELEEG